MALSAIKKPTFSGQGGGGNNAAMHALVQFLGVELADPTGKKATPGKDVVVVGLMNDAFGKKAEFDDNGMATTIMKFTQTPATKTKDGYIAREIGALVLGDTKLKGGLQPGDMLRLDSARVSKDGPVFDFIKVYTHKYVKRLSDGLPCLDVPINDIYVRVKPKSDAVGTDGEKYVKQEVEILMGDCAVPVEGINNLKDAMEQAMANADSYFSQLNAGEKAPGRFQYILRAYEVEDGVPYVHTRTISPLYNKETKETESPADTAARLLNWDRDDTDYNRSIGELMAELKVNDSARVEIIPRLTVNYGGSSLARKLPNEAEYAHPVIDDENPNKVIKRNNGEYVHGYGYMRSSLLLSRLEGDDGSLSNWFVVEARPIFAAKANSVAFKDGNVPSAAMDQDVAAMLVKQATEHHQKAVSLMRADMEENKKASPDAPNHAHDDDAHSPRPGGM